MSVTESKAKATKKATSAKKSADSVAVKALNEALEAAPTTYVILSCLVKSPHNVRTIPYSPESVTELADSISIMGLLQNLVVHMMPDGFYGAAAGGRRLAAMQQLVECGKYSGNERIAVKVIPESLAAVASTTENVHRVEMHPAEQIVAFRTLVQQGQTPAQISDLMGYGPRHVQRMLKLAGLAPAILDALASDELTTEHCHALALEDDHERQLQVLEAAKERSYNGKPQRSDIRNLITASEVRISDSGKFAFVGAEVFEDGQIRRDLFSEDHDGYVDRVLLDTHLMHKLERVAAALQGSEGWAWCLHRMSAVSHYGDDAQDYTFLPEPAPLFTDAERARTETLTAAFEQIETDTDERDAIEQQIEDLDAAVVIRSWTAEQKAQAGVVVSFARGEVCIQRGVLLRENEQAQESTEAAKPTVATPISSYSREPDPIDAISVPLLTKMSSERTLAVQAALMQQTPKAIALLAWKLCSDLLARHSGSSVGVKISLSCSHYTLVDNAPSGKEGVAYRALQAEKERIAALLPSGWETDFTTFFTLGDESLMAILGLCVACGLDGVQTRECGHTSRSPLNTLETALDFHLRDWWQPTKAHFFDHLKKAQIIEFLNDAGAEGAARDGEKMKKGDIAELAEERMAGNRWVPVWMKAPEAKATATGNESDVHAETPAIPDAA